MKLSKHTERITEMASKIFDSELKLMELIWEHEGASAKDISLIAEKEIGWNKNTTYTILKKLEGKNCILRKDPGYICSSLVSREDVQKSETRSLLDKLFKGSRKALFSSLISDESITENELEELRKLIDGR